MQPGGRASFEPFQPQTQILQLQAQLVFRRLVQTTATDHFFADKYFAAQEGPGGQNYRFCRQKPRFLTKNTRNSVIFDRKRGNLVLDQHQPLLSLQNLLHPDGIGWFVALHPVGAHRWAFAAVQHPKLDSRAIRVERNFAAQGIQLKHHVRFGYTADGRIARHPGGRGWIHGDQSHRGSQASGG